MRIFQDIFSDEEFISDSYKMNMLFDNVIVEVPSKMVVLKDADVDIGCGNAFGGQNEDEEAGGNANSAPVAKVCDLIDAFRYEETSFDKPGFQGYFKEYMKKLLEYLQKNKQDRVEPFKAGAREFFKWVLNNFGELTFYTGPSYDMENMIVMSYYKNADDEAPTFLYVMDGMKSYKV